jgi:cyclohexadieny/prephenate dehydrogenase
MSQPLFERVAIIGFGLIGSSIARDIAANGLAGEIVCIDTNQDHCKKVMELGLASQAIGDAATGVRDAELVIIATPISTYQGIARAIAPALQPGTIVTDVGSVKVAVIEAMAGILPAGVHFVPGHPIAGGEKSGPEAGSAGIFRDRWCVLTPPPETNRQAVEKMAALWTGMGAWVEEMDAAHHDRVLAMTSHLPHLIGFTIVHTANKLAEDTKSEVIKFSAGGFRDSTRIAASDPTMWRDVLLNNREAVLSMLQRFTEELTMLQKAIRDGDGETLFSTFSRTRDIRRAVIDQKQAFDASSTPDLASRTA